MRGGGQKMSVFVHVQCIKTVHAKGGLNVVVECPLTYWQSQVKNGMNQHGETNNNQWKKFSMMYSRFRGTRKYCSATKVSNNQNYLV